MAAIEQGQLRISGIPCDSPPFRLQISQGFNRHGRMTAGLWIPEETRKELHLNMQVILELDGGGPVFCGVVERATAGKEKGQDCVYLEARTGSCLLDRKKRKRSFQRQGRSYKELAGEVAAPYQGYPVWKTGAGGEKECGFLLQYEETDWEFLRRALSAGGEGAPAGIPFSRKRVLYRPAGQPVRGGNTIRPLQYKEPSSRKCPGGWDDMHRSGVCVEGLR